MHPTLIIRFISLAAFGATQNVTSSANIVLATNQNPVDVDYDETTTITLPGSTGGGIVYECEIKAEGEGDEVWYGYDCESIADVNLPTPTIRRRGPAILADPVGVLEARMGRKFGVEARQTDVRSTESQLAAVNRNASCAACSTITVTSTSIIERIPSSCLPSPTHYPHIFTTPTLAPVPAAQVTALSIVANLLSQEIAAAAPPTSSPDLISAILSALTANVSTMVETVPTPISNMTITATLASATSYASLYPPPSQAKSGGTSAAVGLLANIMAAAGVAYLLA